MQGDYIITFCVVALDEADSIQSLLKNLCFQTYPHEKIEVILVDGGSVDRTKTIMKDFQQKFSSEFFNILVLENKKKTLPCGWNIALDNFEGDAIVRVDAHAEIPNNFIEENVNHLTSGDYVCGGYRPNIIDENTPLKKTLLAAETSMFGSSFANFRRKGKERYVKSVFHGAYRREVFNKVGRFNEKLTRTEDNEMNYRIRKAGFKIHFYPDIISYQHTRNSLLKMLRQKFLNGYWIAKTLFITPGCISLVYFFPFFFFFGIIITSILAVFGFDQSALILWSIYGLFSGIATVCSLIFDENRDSMYLFLPVLFFLLHVSYGIGTFIGLGNASINRFLSVNSTIKG